MIDSVELRQDSFYDEKGITAISNNNAVVSRDQNGNILVQPSSSLLVIEAITTNVLAESVIPLLNTQFNYFKFPARTAIVDETLDLDLDLDLNLDSIDPIYARYNPSEDRKILASTTTPAGILMDQVEDGLFQQKTNRYYISKVVNDANVPLRFRIKLTTEFISTNDSLESSRQQFTLIKSNSNGIDRFYAGPFNMPGSDSEGRVNNGDINVLELDLEIPADQFTQGDTFGIGAYADHNNDVNYHIIFAQESYWSITDATKQVDEYNNPITEIETPVNVTATATTTTTNVPIGNYEPFGEAGTVDGETRTFTAGGYVNDIYKWDAITQSWNKQ